MSKLINKLKQRICKHDYVLAQTIINKSNDTKSYLYTCKKCNKTFTEIDW